MNLENEILYIKNKEYIYVLTNNSDNYNELDISIFEIEEWTNLTKISKVFEGYVFNLDVDKSLRPYININQNLKDCIHYLHRSPFCRFKGFNDLEYEILKINGIYEVVFNPFNRKCYYIDYIVYLICYHKFHFLTFLLSCMLTRNK